MNPYQRLAAANCADCRAPTDAWERTAPVLRAWAKSAKGSEAQQENAICIHKIRVLAPCIMDRAPEFAEHAQAFRVAPCAADWRRTFRQTQGAVESTFVGSNAIPWSPAWYAALRDAEQAALRANFIRPWIPTSGITPPRDGSVFYAHWFATWATARRSLKGHNDGAAFRQAAEEWILLARPVVPPLYAVLLDPHASPEPDAYAVAWDALAARLDTGGTDDGRRICHGLDANGAPLPVWARRTALARCVVRSEVIR